MKKEATPLEEYQKKENSLKYSILDGSFYSIMESFTANFIRPFALVLKASNTFIALISTLPGLISVIFQFLTINYLNQLPRKRTIVIGAFLHGLIWIPIAFVPYFFPNKSNLALLLLLILSSTFAAVINPLWSSLMGDLVPEETRGRYFSKRNAICGSVAFVFTFLAGLFLNYFSLYLGLLATFGIMFILAFMFRMASVYYLSIMYEPIIERKNKVKPVSFHNFFLGLKQTHYGKFTLYLCFMSFSVNIAGPFFIVYMLKNLQFSYLQFTIITLVSVVSTFVSMYFLGKLTDKIGNKRVLVVSGLLISLIPLPWIFFTNFYVLLLVEVFSGIVWAGFNLSASNFVYDAAKPEEITSYVVYLNLLRGMAIFLGSLLGGLITGLDGFIFSSGIILAFLISGILRLIVGLFFFRQIPEMRLVEVSINRKHSRERLFIVPRHNYNFELQTVPAKKKQK